MEKILNIIFDNPKSFYRKEEIKIFKKENDLESSQDIFCFIHFGNKNSIPLCECGNELKFKNFFSGFRQFCSLKCMGNSETTKNKKQQSYFEKTGFKNPSENPEVAEKKRKTMLEKYGVENPSQVEEIQILKKRNSIEKRGVESHFQTEEYAEHRKDIFFQKTGFRTAIEKFSFELFGDKDFRPVCECGNELEFVDSFAGYRQFCSKECARKSETVKERKKNTMLERYGIENCSQIEEIKEKKKQTTLSNFGVENPLHSEVIKEKIKSTNLEKYGAECVFENEFIKEKIKSTNLEKYGVEHITKRRDFCYGTLEYFIKKYGDNELARFEFSENCHRMGFCMTKPNQDIPGKLYYIKFFNEDICFWKIGITRKDVLKERFSHLPKTGLKAEIIFVKEGFLYEECFLTEQRILEKFSSKRISINYNGFKTSEAFSENVLDTEKEELF